MFSYTSTYVHIKFNACFFTVCIWLLPNTGDPKIDPQYHSPYYGALQKVPLIQILGNPKPYVPLHALIYLM